MGLTRAQIRGFAKQRADMENSSYVSDTEWNQLIDEAGGELHDLILQSNQLLLNSTTSISLVAGTEAYSLPATFYNVTAVYYMQGTQRFAALEQCSMHDFGLTPELWWQYPTNTWPTRYALVGSQIWFYPKPIASGTVQLQFVPQYVPFANDNTELSYPYVQGWEQFIIVTSAIKALQKEETVNEVLLGEKAQVQDRIRQCSQTRDNFSPRKSRNVYASGYRLRRYGRRLRM